MSISSEISRISGNVSDSLAAVAAKGVTVPSGSNSDDLAGLIAQISGGGTGAIAIDDTADSHGGVVRTITAVDISDTTATAADVMSGKYFYTANGTKTAGTGSGGSVDCPVFSISLSTETGTIASITCDKTYAEALAYYNTGTVQTTELAVGHVTAIYQGQTAIDSKYPMYLLSTQNNTLTYYMYVGSMGAIPYYQINYASNGTITWTEEPIPERDSDDLIASNLTVTAPAGYYASAATKTLSDQNLVAGNIKKDVTIFGTTGSYEGGSSSTVQVYEGWDYKTSTTLAATDVSITIAEAGTYRISWMGFRNNSQNTFGTQLYKNGTAYGSEVTTFTRTYGVRVSIAGVQLAKNDVITVYARARSTSYYMYVGQLMAVKTG